MKLLVALTAVGTLVSGFQPTSNKGPIVRSVKTDTPSLDIIHGGNKDAPLTKHDMVAIRSPFWQVFSGESTKSDKASVVPVTDYVVDRDYTVAMTLIAVGLWLAVFGPTTTYTADGFAHHSLIDLAGAAFHTWFGAFIGMQTMRTRAVFGRDSFELKSVSNKYLGFPDKGLTAKKYKNYVLKTNNKWRYDSFVNWDFFPSIHLPILVYFKETQTPENMQISGTIGTHHLDRRENGQMHWFPAYCNVWQLREQFEAHGCQKIGPVHGEEFMKSE